MAQTGKTQARQTTLAIKVKIRDDDCGKLPDYLGSFASSLDGIDLNTHTVIEAPANQVFQLHCGVHEWYAAERYFVSSDNYTDETPENREKYAAEDLARMLRYLTGDLASLGVRAVATFTIPVFGDSTMQQTVNSPGLWGIESDSEPSEFDRVACEEVAELRTLLLNMGIDLLAVNGAANAALLEYGATEDEMFTPAANPLPDSPADFPVEKPAENPAENALANFVNILLASNDADFLSAADVVNDLAEYMEDVGLLAAPPAAIDYSTAVATLKSEGFDGENIDAAIDSLIESGITYEHEDETMLTDAEVGVIREQLTTWATDNGGAE